MLSYIVTFVKGSRRPVMPKLQLRNSIAEPIETHVHGVCPLGGDCVVHYAECHGGVRLDGGGGLWVAHFGECVPVGYRRAAVDVEDAKLGPGGGGHDGL